MDINKIIFMIIFNQKKKNLEIFGLIIQKQNMMIF